MNFGFDEDQKSLADTVGQALADIPALLDPSPTPAGNAAAWSALAELGLFALLVPERFDGVGLTLVDLALAIEVMGATMAPPLAASTLAATDLIVRHGTDAQQRRWLPRISTGDLKVALALYDVDQSYDPASVRTRLADTTVSGNKMTVVGGGEADLVIVLVQAGGRPALLAIERDADGLSTTPQDSIDPSASLSSLALVSVGLGDDALLGQSSPERAVERLMDVSATIAAGLLTGIAGRMLDRSVEYAKTRVQFGQPIGAFQAIKHRCADMAVAVETARSAAYYAFWAVAEDTPDRARAASMAKAYCGASSRNVCNETIQVHGGMGFTWELGLHRYLRRSKLIEHLYGDAAWHNERLLVATLAGMEKSEGARSAA